MSKRLRVGLLGFLLLALHTSAMAYRVIYDFSGDVDGDTSRPFIGSLYFHSDTPPIGDVDGWVTHGRNGVLSLSFDDLTWKTVPGKDALCEIDFHVGWSLVRAWCNAAREVSSDARTFFILEFFEPKGRINYLDYDPIGPYDEETLLHYRLTATFWVPPYEEGPRGMGSLNNIRVVSEPGTLGLLALALLPSFARWRGKRSR